jgi:hypothetical protein
LSRIFMLGSSNAVVIGNSLGGAASLTAPT